MADKALYDQCLEACLAGKIEEPGVFLARHPDASDEARAGVERIEQPELAGSEDA